MSSSKTACLHRRQAARKKKQARLRITERTTQRTMAAQHQSRPKPEYQAQVEEVHPVVAYRRGRGRRLVGTVVGGAVIVGAASTGGAVSTAAFVDPYHPSPLAHYLPWAPSYPGYPDYPHTPEQEVTFDPVFYAAGTATTAIPIGSVSASWDPWEWTYRPTIFGD
jgi:hypothetical protein